ncbi:hypothetical protein JCM31185_17350 [Furfurilactobacillus curtus]|uniref:Uncharacterized protein n=1 Tax=Furfurilactobacillus curtus TaxID=1746200 RepID=A0ABQ5JQ15_9LACO
MQLAEIVDQIYLTFYSTCTIFCLCVIKTVKYSYFLRIVHVNEEANDDEKSSCFRRNWQHRVANRE